MSDLRDHVFANREILVGLTVRLRAFVMSVSVNKRKFAGLMLMAGAPLVFFIYKLPFLSITDHYWEFHLNWHYYLKNESLYLSTVVFLLGYYKTMPVGQWQGKILIPAAGFVLAILIKDTLASTNDEINALPGWVVCTTAICATTILFLSMDYFIWANNHRVEAFKARKKGMKQIAFDVPAEKFRMMVLQFWSEEEGYNTRF